MITNVLKKWRSLDHETTKNELGGFRIMEEEKQIKDYLHTVNWSFTDDGWQEDGNNSVKASYYEIEAFEEVLNFFTQKRFENNYVIKALKELKEIDFEIELEENEDSFGNLIELYYGGTYLGDASESDNKYVFDFDTVPFEYDGKLLAKAYDRAGNKTEIFEKIKIDTESNKVVQTDIGKLKNLKRRVNELFTSYGIFGVDIPQELLDFKGDADSAYLDANVLMKTNVVFLCCSPWDLKVITLMKTKFVFL